MANFKISGTKVSKLESLGTKVSKLENWGIKVSTLGTRHTVLENLIDLWSSTCIRSRDEFVRLLNIELGTTSRIENDTLLIKGVFTSRQIAAAITKLSLLQPSWTPIASS